MAKYTRRPNGKQTSSNKQRKSKTTSVDDTNTNITDPVNEQQDSVDDTDIFVSDPGMGEQPEPEPEFVSEAKVPTILKGLVGKKTEPANNAPIVARSSSAQVYIDMLSRTMARYIEYCGVGRHVERNKMIAHQRKLWTTIKTGIINTDMEGIDKYLTYVLKLFHHHKEGVLGEQRLFRYIIDQSTGNTTIDAYAIEIYSLFQIACEKYDESRSDTIVDINKAVANADPEVGEKVYAFFNKLGTSPLEKLVKEQPET